jgi:hypothetical protein
MLWYECLVAEERKQDLFILKPMKLGLLKLQKVVYPAFPYDAKVY